MRPIAKIARPERALLSMIKISDMIPIVDKQTKIIPECYNKGRKSTVPVFTHSKHKLQEHGRFIIKS
jgi:hypothetical protein